jgi:hypothetical protein
MMLVYLLQVITCRAAAAMLSNAIPYGQPFGLVLLQDVDTDTVMSLQTEHDNTSKGSEHAKAIVVSLTFEILNDVFRGAAHPHFGTKGNVLDQFPTRFKN